MVVTIDGPSGAGKSTVAKAVSQRLGFAFLDTGALYRAVALAASMEQIDPDDEKAVAAWLPGVDIEVQAGGGAFTVLYGGSDVEPFIRNEEIGGLASRLSAQKAVRGKLLELQRRAADAGDLVCEGRDMGTVVFPGAEFKFFLNADPRERARRRLADLKPYQPSLTLGQVMEDMARRDERDSHRALSPLEPAGDAEIVDTTPLNREEVIELVVDKVSAKN